MLVRDMFANLLKDTHLAKTALSSKSAAIFVRAFLFGQKHYSSSEFKKKFAEFYPFVSRTGIEGLLYKLSNYGYYQVARNIFEGLFQCKQLYKKMRAL
jgi:hypothetical protein